MKATTTISAKHSYIAKVKKGKKVFEHKFNSFSSTAKLAKEDLKDWFLATRQKVEVISVKKA